ncbi:hypothetical protein ACUN7Z_09835 [Vreelandella venusta]
MTATDGSSVLVTDPASGETIGHVPPLKRRAGGQAIEATSVMH